MYNMWNGYVVAPRNEMIIRIVEAEDFIGQIVTERRPLSFPDDIKGFDDGKAVSLQVALSICMFIVLSFGALVACGLDVVLASMR